MNATKKSELLDDFCYQHDGLWPRNRQEIESYIRDSCSLEFVGSEEREAVEILCGYIES